MTADDLGGWPLAILQESREFESGDRLRGAAGARDDAEHMCHEEPSCLTQKDREIIQEALDKGPSGQRILADHIKCLRDTVGLLLETRPNAGNELVDYRLPYLDRVRLLVAVWCAAVL